VGVSVACVLRDGPLLPLRPPRGLVAWAGQPSPVKPPAGRNRRRSTPVAGQTLCRSTPVAGQTPSRDGSSPSPVNPPPVNPPPVGPGCRRGPRLTASACWRAPGTSGTPRGGGCRPRRTRGRPFGGGFLADGGRFCWFGVGGGVLPKAIVRVHLCPPKTQTLQRKSNKTTPPTSKKSVAASCQLRSCMCIFPPHSRTVPRMRGWGMADLTPSAAA
jgi:hypothetical protein